MELITKEQLLQGAEYREQMEIPELGMAVEIRPLTAREWMNLSDIRVRDLQKRGGVKKSRRDTEVTLDLIAIQESNFLMKCELVSMGMMNPSLSPDEVSKLKVSVLDQINARIRIISGIDEEAKAEAVSFRGERGRSESGNGGDELPSG